ncbi:MAG: DUF3987 domain-containing protein, partial [Silvanigrellaceae bacterium]|nr:DUF3987 domain-containing protein [Silvanigrellaceae bacterium]
MANVARDEFLISPVSLYLIAIAHSGERKSAADNLFSRPVRQWEQTIRQKCEPMLLSALTEHKAWQMERDGLLSKIRRAAFSENDTNSEHYKELLNRLMQEEPMIPVQPSLYFEDVTAEALSLHLRENWPSAALWSDEAGIIIGSHGMQASPTRFVALLNRLWEDKAFTTHRKTSRSFVLENRRLTLSLMMQPVLFEKLLAHPLNIHRQSGFLARCLLCFPESSIGTRFYEEPVGSLEGQEIYEKRITECLNEAAHLDERGCVNLKML